MATKTPKRAKDSAPRCPFKIGHAYFFRTVTYHLVGRVTAIIGDFVILVDAAWIADSGRFHLALANGTLNEVEPVGDAVVALASVTDAFPWKHALPLTVK